MSVTERQQTCPRCSAELDVSTAAVGAWLACPGCDQPIQVTPRRIVRPNVPKDAEPPSSAWLSDPRLDVPARSPAAPVITEATPPLPAWSPQGMPPTAPAIDPLASSPGVAPKRYRSRRFGGMTFLLSVMCATAQVIFAGSVLQAVTRPQDIALSAIFGAGLGAFVAQMAFSIRREDSTRARHGPG